MGNPFDLVRDKVKKERPTKVKERIRKADQKRAKRLEPLQNGRCDACNAYASIDPESLKEVLAWLAPPVELLSAIERWQAIKEKNGDQLTESVIAWYNRWCRLNRGEEVPELDWTKATSFRDRDQYEGRERD